MDLLEPFATFIGPRGDSLESGATRLVRRLSGLRTVFSDQQACAAVLSRDDPVIYEVLVAPVPETEGHLCHGVTVLLPGRVGDEYFMTKGHYHRKSATGEVYYGLRGTGLLLLQTRQGDWRTIEVAAGTVAYVPPHWGHRSVNTGEDPLVLLYAYPGDAGHDYDTIEATGFARLVVARNGRPAVVENPRFAPTQVR